MPELPEVETVRSGLAPFIEGARIESVTLNLTDLRFASAQGFADGLEERTISNLGRRAKYLLATVSDGAVGLDHLGMTGAFLVGERGLNEPSWVNPAEQTGRHV